jgi:hypothetical protein
MLVQNMWSVGIVSVYDSHVREQIQHVVRNDISVQTTSVQDINISKEVSVQDIIVSKDSSSARYSFV